MGSLPFPFIANTAGWMTAEFGRQPFVVYGLLRTAEGTSEQVSTGNTVFTLLGFAGMYAFVSVVFLFVMLRIVARGPDENRARRRNPLMETLWFWLVASMLATFVVLDGFDLGCGILYLFVARDGDERIQVLRTVGPVWDGNEVWLVAGGGVLFLAFPTLYAASFSGFYLPLMMVLWLLMGRALGLEMRHQMEDPLWTQFWDAIFALSSALLALFLGVALGNIIRGVPLNEQGVFFEPLWTDFRVREATGILDWFTVLVGLNSVAALTYHAALWLDWRGADGVRARIGKVIPPLFVSLLVLSIATLAASLRVQPLVSEHLSARPWSAILPDRRHRRDGRLASSAPTAAKRQGVRLVVARPVRHDPRGGWRALSVRTPRPHSRMGARRLPFLVLPRGTATGPLLVRSGNASGSELHRVHLQETSERNLDASGRRASREGMKRAAPGDRIHGAMRLRSEEPAEAVTVSRRSGGASLERRET